MVQQHNVGLTFQPDPASSVESIVTPVTLISARVSNVLATNMTAQALILSYLHWSGVCWMTWGEVAAR